MLFFLNVIRTVVIAYYSLEVDHTAYTPRSFLGVATSFTWGHVVPLYHTNMQGVPVELQIEEEQKEMSIENG